MDSSDFPVSKSPTRELQGPRPAPLKVSKDSRKIKKPPAGPPPPPPQLYHHHHQQHHHHQAPPAAPPRLPVIIYDVSPKVIHTNPNDFMNLVQRLTGNSSTTSSFITSTSSSSSASAYIDPSSRDNSAGGISPAARLASIEKTKQSPTDRNKKLLQIHDRDNNNNKTIGGGGNGGFVEGIEMDHGIEISRLFPGILSPGPTTLPVISPSFFSPPSDPNIFSFLHDMSPELHGRKNIIEGSLIMSPMIAPSFVSPPSDPNYTFSFLNDLSPELQGNNKICIEGNFMPSPSTFFSPRFTSPTPSIDLFNYFFDC